MLAKRMNFNDTFSSVFNDVFCLDNSFFDLDQKYEKIFDNYKSEKQSSIEFTDEETKEKVIQIPVLGYSKEDISIEVNEAKIEIKGKIKDEKLKSKLVDSSFEYIYHSKGIDVDSFIAKVNNGILEIRYKLSIDKTTKKIEIK